MAVVTVTSVSVILMLQVMRLCDTSQTSSSCIHIILHGKKYAFEQLKIFTGLGCHFSSFSFFFFFLWEHIVYDLKCW